MTNDLVASFVARLEAKAEAWETLVTRMRELSPANPPADALARAAKELRELAHEVEHQVVEVGPAAYARSHGVSAVAVRTWCVLGQLPGARQDDAGRWHIPVAAVRQRDTLPATRRRRSA